MELCVVFDDAVGKEWGDCVLDSTRGQGCVYAG
jgi:hypothetical protein